MTKSVGQYVYFVRHGQTVFNKEKRLQGWKDSPLSDAGIGHAKIMGDALKDHSFSEVWVSPLGRAIQTTEVMRESMPFEYETAEDLREVSFGDFEGYTLPQIDEKFPGMWEARQNDKWNYRPPGGESNKDGLERALRIKERIEKSDSSQILIVAHFAINRLVISQFVGIEPQDTMRINVPHGIIYRLTNSNDGWRLEWQMADKLEQGYEKGWLPQYESENQLIPKY